MYLTKNVYHVIPTLAPINYGGLWDFSNMLALVHNALWRPEVTTATNTVTEKYEIYVFCYLKKKLKTEFNHFYSIAA